jgi:putative tricarboxylic transport membrane protein
LLSLGIPGSATSAVLLGAFIMLGIQPGPRLFAEHADIAWGLIASMYLGNIMLLFINTIFISAFLWLLSKAQAVMPIVVSTLCVIGTYSVANSVSDIFLMLVFAGLGVLFKKLKIPPAPAIIALVLGGQLEFTYRQTLEYFRGNFFRSFERPLTGVIFALCGLLLVVAARKSYKRRKARVRAS